MSLKDNHVFAVLDTKGESPRVYRAELGFYVSDTRYLSHWEMTVNGAQLVYLSHELRGLGNSCVFSMTNRDIPSLDGQSRIPRDTLLIRRILTIHKDSVFEHLEFTNYDVTPHELEIEQLLGATFDDIFEVRGVTRRERGRVSPPAATPSGVRLDYEGLDKVQRTTFVRCLSRGVGIETYANSAVLTNRLKVAGKGRADLKTLISFDREAEPELYNESFQSITVTDHLKGLENVAGARHLGALEVHSDNVVFDRCMKTALFDIEMLTSCEDAATGSMYPYAGIPWFSAPFGRDGILTAYQTLPFYPKLARGVLDFVFRTIGRKTDPFTEEEPGKIFHELRRGEMASLREIPHLPYYGSVDATPLALILLGEYVAWTLDREKLADWWPAARMAVQWLDRHTDADPDGFVSYLKGSAAGLDNQGWKDSHNAIMHNDGTLARAPIQLCEVQAYVYRARLAMAELARLQGENDYAEELASRALRLRQAFAKTFWDSRDGYVYLARDAERRPCAVMSSNQGHCLWGKILGPAEAESVAAHLMSARLFSGFGIRTLAADEKAFNPLSYHNGSIWPHDNSLIAEGFRYYGLANRLQTLADGLFDVVALSDDSRLPELFCGFRRRTEGAPVPYEVACRPQSWAAGSVYLILKSLLGLSIDTARDEVVFQSSPLLPKSVNSLEIRDLRVRDTEFGVLVVRGRHDTCHIEITRRCGQMRILVQK